MVKLNIKPLGIHTDNILGVSYSLDRVESAKELADELKATLKKNKINYKDFELYHKGTHPRSQELDLYFRNWFFKLGVSDTKYQEYKKLLTVLGK